MPRTAPGLLMCLFSGALLACDYSSGSESCVPTQADAACLAGPPTFVAVVTRVIHEQGNTPAGPLSQYDFWMAIIPSDTANVGVVAGTGVPVFLQVGSGPLFPTGIANIQVGDRVAAWTAANPAYGSAEAPPGAPAYLGQQLVIQR